MIPVEFKEYENGPRRGSMWHYWLTDANGRILEYVTELQETTGLDLRITHWLYDGEKFYPIQFDPFAYMTFRDFKWLCEYYTRLGIVLLPMTGHDYLRNGHTSLIASVDGLA